MTVAAGRPAAPRRTAAVLAVTVVCVAALAACSSSGSSGPKASGATTVATTAVATTVPLPKGPRVDVYGDSLTVQASDALRVLGRAHDLDVTVAAYFGLAPCDLAASISKDLRKPPSVLVLAFSGNNITPCMGRGGHPLVGAPYFAAYRHDVDGIVAAATAAKVPVLIVGPPVFPTDLNVPDRVELNTLYRQIAAAHPDARYVETATALGARVWRRTLPCESGETAALGCHNGVITVRGPTRIHFDDARTVPCPTGHDVCSYSAGARRYADAIFAGLAQIPGLAYAPGPSTAGVPIDVTKDG